MLYPFYEVKREFPIHYKTFFLINLVIYQAIINLSYTA